MKSIRSLLWVLWGLGWVIVPVTFGALLHMGRFIPAIMFTSLAAIFIVTWHKGALIRAALRKVQGSRALAEGRTPEEAVRRRIEALAPASPQVRCARRSPTRRW